MWTKNVVILSRQLNSGTCFWGTLGSSASDASKCYMGIVAQLGRVGIAMDGNTVWSSTVVL